jgi:hypothetical protein
MSTETKPQETSKKKKYIRLAGIVFGVIFALLAAVLLLRNIIVEQTITRVAPLVTGTPVKVESFSSNLFTGEIVLKGFKVGNPEGYVEPYAFVFETLRVKLPPLNLLKKELTIQEIFISGIGINFELKIDGSSNLTDIQKNVDKFTKSLSSGKEQKEKPAPKAESKGPKKQIIIAQFRQEQGFISASIGLTSSTVRLPLPPVELTDIGGGSNLGETISVVFSEMLNSVSKALSATGLNMKNLKNLSDSVTKGLSDSGNFLLKSGEKGSAMVVKGASDAGKAISDGAADAGKALVDGVNNLFKKRK